MINIALSLSALSAFQPCILLETVLHNSVYPTVGSLRGLNFHACSFNVLASRMPFPRLRFFSSHYTSSNQLNKVNPTANRIEPIHSSSSPLM